MIEMEISSTRLNRLLVTGGAGFIGSNFVRHSLKSGCTVLNVDSLTYAANAEVLKEFSQDSRYSFLQADIVDSATLSRAFFEFQPTTVVNLAAETHVDRSIANSNPFVHSNIMGANSLLQVSLDYWRSLSANSQNDFRFLHVSTDEVYGSLGSHGKFTEASKYDPHSPYSASKAAADHIVRAFFHTHELPVLLVHPSNNYGANQHPEKLIPLVVRCCWLRQPIPVYGSGLNVRDWLYVDDHCEAISSVLLRGSIGQSYNVGGGNEWQNIKLVERLCDLFDEIVPNKAGPPSRQLIQFVADRPGHDFRYSLDCSKIELEVGWKPTCQLEDGFRKTMQWYLHNPARLQLPLSIGRPA